MSSDTSPAIEPVRIQAARSYQKDRDSDAIRPYPAFHGGKGVIGFKKFFGTGAASSPALLLLYSIPPGASEGIHTHRSGDPVEGSFDEFYYVIEGRGEMQIDGETLPIEAGDHVFTPNGTAHGIENTASDGVLKVYVVAMKRE